jgi:hypothetical protein
VLAEGGGCNYKAYNQNLVGGKRRGYEGCNSKVLNLHCVEGYESSVADPDPADPRVFGPPGSGSGSISQRY